MLPGSEVKYKFSFIYDFKLLLYFNAHSTGAILGATEAIVSRSFTRDVYLQSRRVPDWSNLADNMKEVDIRAA